MEREELNTLAARVKRVMSEAELNALGREVRFCRRERTLTPSRLAVAIVGSFALRPVETLAVLQRAFNALFDAEVEYKPYHNPPAKWAFPAFVRELASRLLEALVVKVLTVGREGAFAEFRRIVIQDGSSFAVKGALAQHFPARFRTVSPAAVELHVMRDIDLLEESVERVALVERHPTLELRRHPDLRGVLDLKRGRGAAILLSRRWQPWPESSMWRPV
jgi:hypothetical protein